MSDFSVIIPTHNRAAFLGAALDSVLAQTLPPLEIIVIDDGSTDDTEQVAQSFGRRITYVSQEKRGRWSACNRGAEMARGRMLAFLDSDDTWLPAKLERQAAVLRRRPDAALVHCWHTVIDGLGQPSSRRSRVIAWHYHRALRAGYTYPSMALECILFPSTVVIPREVFIAVGGWDPAVEPLADWDLFLRLSLAGPVVTVAEPLVRYRAHGDQLSSEGHEQAWGSIRVCRKHLNLLASGVDIPVRWRSTVQRNLAIRLGEAFFILGDFDGARQWLTDAVRRDPLLAVRPIWGRHFLLPHLVLSWLPQGVRTRLNASRRPVARQ